MRYTKLTFLIALVVLLVVFAAVESIASHAVCIAAQSLTVDGEQVIHAAECFEVTP